MRHRVTKKKKITEVYKTFTLLNLPLKAKASNIAIHSPVKPSFECFQQEIPPFFWAIYYIIELFSHHKVILNAHQSPRLLMHYCTTFPANTRVSSSPLEESRPAGLRCV